LVNVMRGSKFFASAVFFDRSIRILFKLVGNTLVFSN
jgi:hypothetical protein